MEWKWQDINYQQVFFHNRYFGQLNATLVLSLVRSGVLSKQERKGNLISFLLYSDPLLRSKLPLLGVGKVRVHVNMLHVYAGREGKGQKNGCMLLETSDIPRAGIVKLRSSNNCSWVYNWFTSVYYDAATSRRLMELKKPLKVKHVVVLYSRTNKPFDWHLSYQFRHLLMVSKLLSQSYSFTWKYSWYSYTKCRSLPQFWQMGV